MLNLMYMLKNENIFSFFLLLPVTLLNYSFAFTQLLPFKAAGKEFITAKWPAMDSWRPSTKLLCRDVLILMTDETAGLRAPGQCAD
jgi:hypothetical protein